MQNSEIAKLPNGLLRKVNIYESAPGVVIHNQAGQSIATHNSPIVMHDVISTGADCPTCAAMGKQIQEIPFDQHLPYLGAGFEP